MAHKHTHTHTLRLYSAILFREIENVVSVLGSLETLDLFGFFWKVSHFRMIFFSFRCSRIFLLPGRRSDGADPDGAAT